MRELASAGQLRMSLVRAALVLVPLILLLGIASGRLANSGYGNPWFAGLAKPAFMPPGWAFGAAWSILYVLMGLALAIVVTARRAPGRGLAIGLFVVQLMMNLAWSPLFFAAHRVQAALWLIVALAVIVAVTALAFGRVRRVAGVLMLPYLAWLCFAAVLNYEIGRLNPGAEQLAPTGKGTQIQI